MSDHFSCFHCLSYSMILHFWTYWHVTYIFLDPKQTNTPPNKQTNKLNVSPAGIQADSLHHHKYSLLLGCNFLDLFSPELEIFLSAVCCHFGFVSEISE